jgi:LAS superfamily LD-carboxypeptidase LdcB
MRRSTPARAAALALTLVAAALFFPEASDAGPQQTPEEQQEDVRRRQGEVALEIDVLEAQAAEVAAALDTLEANVAAQEAALADAEAAVDTAEAELAEAEAEVADAQARVTALNLASDRLVVESFVAPPSWSMLDALEAETLSDAAIMQALLDIQSETEADVLEELEQAEEDLEQVRDEKAALAGQAEEAQVAAEQQLGQVRAAYDQQAQFAADAQDALDRKLVEAQNLEEIDAELSEQIEAQQAALARQLAAANVQPAPSEPTVIGDVEVANVTCSSGSTITVAASIASDVQNLLDASAADGLSLCGWGYRSTQRQIELRMQNCGTSDYLIYEAPSSSCSPPTARPGSSEHETGLAIDFTCGGDSIGSQSSPCFQWLDANAAGYGLYNLPVEPWHWSTTGT